MLRQQSSDAIELWALDDRGNARAGFRARAPSAGPPLSSFGDADVHGSSIAFSVYGVDTDVGQDFVVVAPFTTPAAIVDLGDVDPATPATTDGLQRLHLGDGAVAGELTSLVVERIPLDGSAPSVVTDGEGTLGEIVGETVLFNHFTGPPGTIGVARPQEPAETLIAGPQTNALRIATDGIDMVWLEYDYDGAGMATGYGVYTAPYVEHAADLAPRRIDSPPSFSVTTPVRVGFGHAAVGNGLDGGLRLYRLADGYHADLAPPAGEFWFAPSYLGPMEIAVAAHGADRTYTIQLCFIELASLDWVPST